jgi:SAM-dependent methyltransferase
MNPAPDPALPSMSPRPPVLSAWVRRFVPLAAPRGNVLDVACGSGRHLRWLASLGFAVTGVDRDAEAAMPLQGVAEIVVADLETDPWPLAGRRFDVVLVTNYLWRPLWPALLASLDEGGVLIYETFAAGQQHIGRPSNPEFLLAPGELLQRCEGLRIVAFEDGFEPGGDGVPARFVQRIAAVRPPPDGALEARYGLAAPGG